MTVQLLAIGPILILAGGLLLLWVCWKMWRELRTSAAESHAAEEALANRDLDSSGDIGEGARRKTFKQAAWQIIIADVSMSLDNVLAVAGAAREHPSVLIFGLVLSIALMGVAATFIARLLQKHRWIAYVGLVIIFYVALKMIYEGIFPHEEVTTALQIGLVSLAELTGADRHGGRRVRGIDRGVRGRIRAIRLFSRLVRLRGGRHGVVRPALLDPPDHPDQCRRCRATTPSSSAWLPPARPWRSARK